MINFDEATHTYTRNNEQYTSVTTLLKQYNISADYTNIPTNVLQKAAQRGKETHKAIEDYINTGVITPNNVDLDNFIKYTIARGIDRSLAIAEEVVYDDTYKIAGTIDIQYIDNDEDIIADHKTTSQIHYESVAWQLSIYNYIKCKGDVIQYYIKKLKVLHYYQGKLVVKEIPPIDYDEVIKLLTAHLTNSSYSYTPDISKIISNSESIMLKTILDDIEQCQTLLNDLNKKKEEMQEKIMERMATNGQHEVEAEGFRILYSSGNARKSIDLTQLKIFCELNNIDIDSLYKTTTTKPRITITRRG